MRRGGEGRRKEGRRPAPAPLGDLPGKRGEGTGERRQRRLLGGEEERGRGRGRGGGGNTAAAAAPGPPGGGNVGRAHARCGPKAAQCRSLPGALRQGPRAKKEALASAGGALKGKAPPSPRPFSRPPSLPSLCRAERQRSAGGGSRAPRHALPPPRVRPLSCPCAGWLCGERASRAAAGRALPGVWCGARPPQGPLQPCATCPCSTDRSGCWRSGTRPLNARAWRCAW